MPRLGLLGFGVEAGWFQEQRQQEQQLACDEHNWLHELLSAWGYAMSDTAMQLIGLQSVTAFTHRWQQL